MTDQTNDAAKARAEAAFHLPTTETKPDPLAEYRAKQDSERDKMMRLCELRLAVEGKAKPNDRPHIA
jgi:hypothetical protein